MSESKGEKPEIKEEVAASIRNFSARAKDGVPRQLLALPELIQQKAALISAHFLLSPGSKIVDVACGTGEVTLALALLNPHSEYIGIDPDAAAIEAARKNCRAPNLSFRVSDLSMPDIEDESLDGLVNANVLHHVYSDAGYNADDVIRLLEAQHAKLKPGGTMVIRDYMMPPDGDYVLLELPSTPSRGNTVADLSDADLLILFSQSARPLPSGGSEGFFIEELRQRRESTRLFRLSHKWAVEFVQRKNYRANWANGIKQEYTFFTYQDFRREMARIGLRMTFSAPYWNPWIVKNMYKDRFRLYTEDYRPLGWPATNYFIVSQKVADKQSMVLEERRPSQNPVGDLQIMVVRDKKSGQVHELVKRPGEYCDVVPYRVTPDNRLMVFVRGGYPRPIVNAVSRGSHNLDGKKWSGHLVEPISMNCEGMTEEVEHNREMIFDCVRAYAGLRPKSDDTWHVGATYFPSPDRIDEAIEPVFVEVENPFKTSWPVAGEKGARFAEMGSIIELDGADIILASQVGLLPEPRLEMHVISLMERYGIQTPPWLGERIPQIQPQDVKVYEPEELLAEAEKAEFEKENRAPVHLKPVKAVFVEEGKVGRTTRGLSAQDIEFVVTDDGVENIAIVVPMTRDWDNNLLVALEPKVMPVPNRLGGDGITLNAPSFVLPRDVKDVDDAKAFIAAKFKVPVEQVASLGESYFTHVGVTPQRIYPFTVTAPPGAVKGFGAKYVMMKKLGRLLGFTHRQGMVNIKAFARIQMMSDINHGMQTQRDLTTAKEKTYALSTDKVALGAKDAGYTGVPSRILGERGAMKPPEPEAAGGRRLSQSYTQAKMNVRKMAGFDNLNKGIIEIARSLHKQNEKDEPLPVPPEPGKPRQ